MVIKINGETKVLESTLTLTELMMRFGYADSFVAIAVNRTFVPRSRFVETPVAENDDIEILSPMAGG